MAFNLLIGNHGAHGKNFSLLYEEKGARLAPFYDLISTAVYPDLARKMAMKVGGEYRPDYVMARHVQRFAADSELGAAAVRDRVRLFAATLPDLADNLAYELREAGALKPVHDRILDLLAGRASRLEKELG